MDALISTLDKVKSTEDIQNILNQKLFQAFKNKDLEKFKTLQEQGADLNAKDDDGKTLFDFVTNGAQINFLEDNLSTEDLQSMKINYNLNLHPEKDM